jgi:hypothetical protein
VDGDRDDVPAVPRPTSRHRRDDFARDIRVQNDRRLTEEDFAKGNRLELMDFSRAVLRRATCEVK